MKQEFAAQYYAWLDSHVDLFLCGHPLFWCTLFEAACVVAAPDHKMPEAEASPFVLLQHLSMEPIKKEPSERFSSAPEHMLHSIMNPQFLQSVTVSIS